MSDTFFLRPSRIFFLLLLLLYVMLFVVVSLTALVLWSRILLNVLIILSFIYHLTLDVLLLRRASWISLVLDENRLVVGLRGKDALSGELAPRTVITPYAIVICVRLEHVKLPICRVIFCDALNKEDFRLLRVRLKYDARPVS
ncbi:MAG: hypothetical protein A2342_01555 [Gallionellales bacterium RIFOXYB12_FULL_54_9]|nr:MAG: hypothetical protein A2342_01555 [Gallionellales bacterium RIFOXYB12_FULL_54_9]